MKMLEFWPDYAGALLWTAKGERVSLDDVPLPGDLIERARRWIAEYDDSKLRGNRHEMTNGYRTA